MPTYEYACRECGQHLEVVQSFKDDPLTVCGSCGGALRKVFSAAGIIFKGSGYYVTDTRDKGGKSPTAAPAASDAGSSGGDTKTSGSSSETSGSSSGGGTSAPAATSKSNNTSEAKSA